MNERMTGGVNGQENIPAVLHSKTHTPDFVQLHKETYLETEIYLNQLIRLLLPLLLRSEAKLWSPLSSDEGKAHPYKMNLASEPRVCMCVDMEAGRRA